MTELPKTFDPAEIEARWYARWEDTNAFRPERPEATPFTIVMPPPNVTGSLHIGHALDITLQDILVRHARLQGKDALWVAGTDHAGIATQMVVERQMALSQQKRTDFTRDEFIAKVWDWKAESGGQITQQLRRIGASCDWKNERFTMDAGFSKAVIKVFVDLHNEGLLYRDKRLVNWDPGLKTAISDLEVETREIQGKFWHLRYPLADGSGHISVATTRPETMLADMAVAVNPTDKRYTAMIGKLVKLPITGRLIPIVADDHADPALGSGAVKITPGHDFNDFEVGKRAGFAAGQMLNMLDAGANIIQTSDGLIPDALLGLSVKDARGRVVAMLEEAGAFERVEDRVIQTPYGDRSGAVIEPWLTDQWYVDAKTLAGPAIEAVRSGAIKIVPATWEKTWFQWLENIQPWCVSRQLWWGHQIPAWFDADGKYYVAEDETGARALAGEGVALTRDSDVLDTWFSSALWPFGTLGWPDADSKLADPKLAKHYPNDVLISGFDILFFWDARMAMQGLHFMKEVPWKTLYLHGLVRAPDGSKMSKSKGNTVDPLGLIDKYGADALRFFMASMESQGRDIKLDEKRLEGYRNFATKLWNAARFCQVNGIGAATSVGAPAAELTVNRWIIGEVVQTVAKLDKALADLRFDEAAGAVYHFVWDRFCDWYLELIKTEICDETKAVAGWVFDQILVMLHPFMPFITEELWHAMGARDHDLVLAQWPAPAVVYDQAVANEIDWVIGVVNGVRSMRAELNIAPGIMLEPSTLNASDATLKRISDHRSKLRRMSRVSNFKTLMGSQATVSGSAQIVIGEATLIFPLANAVDLPAERARLTKAIDAATKEADALSKRLDNPSFVERAKPEAVVKAREDFAEKSAEAERLTAALARLG
ncbi:valine--tRNA ligase [Sphingomonas sp.]|uniref:valine--tRNA ligase n=1 Tax=Sphingomonas sp. TaxID=28214 RepID=UPI0025DE2640|nr:valine--tRNA ligase [Sphingomonas sp.]